MVEKFHGLLRVGIYMQDICVCGRCPRGSVGSYKMSKVDSHEVATVDWTVTKTQNGMGRNVP